MSSEEDGFLEECPPCERLLTYQPITPAAQTMRMAIRLKSVAWRRVVGLRCVRAGGSEALGASRRGTTGERWLAETVLERRERSGFGASRPVRSVASPT